MDSEGEKMNQRELNMLTRKFTAYENFEEMCNHVPVLRLDDKICPTPVKKEQMSKLRKAYEEYTGRKAFPYYN